MSKLLAVALLLILSAAHGLAQNARFIIDDDAYLDKVIAACEDLLREHKLKPAESLSAQVHARAYGLKRVPLARQTLTPPDLYERLRESTLSVGAFYRCPDCNAWHFSSAAAFVVGEGVICTCCHVVQAQDPEIKQAYLVAADSLGRVYPVKAVLAADTEADTCFLKIDAPGLKPLPLRTGVRPGERVYCLSHPGGYHYMFTQGMVARLNLRQDEAVDANGQTNRLSRPILFLNVTAEFAPGSSGGPIVDDSGNVVAQVASIADAGDPGNGDDNAAPSPSVPVRFCTAAEEILRLTENHLDRNEGMGPPASRSGAHSKDKRSKR